MPFPIPRSLDPLRRARSRTASPDLFRQSQDTFATFREAGRQLAIQQLAQLGEHGERDHEQFCQDANRVVQQLFVEHARGAEVGANPSVRAADAQSRSL